MKIYECKRDEAEWEGALIICADSKDEAIEIFKEYEEFGYRPHSVKEIEIKKGVMYDDDAR